MSRRVAIIGLPSFGRRVAAELRQGGLSARFVERPGRSPRAAARMLREFARADLVYGIGLSAARNSPADLLARTGKPLLMHWVGTDVVHAQDAEREGRLSRRVIAHATHWADAPWLAEELAPLGVEATEQLLPLPVHLGEPLPLPAAFQVLIYLPPAAHAAYDVTATFAVAEALPGIPFTLIGGFQPDATPPNVQNLGLVDDMPSVYANSTVFLRLVHHDGMSHTVLEALSLGRHALWSYPFPGVLQVTGADAAVQAISDLRAQHEAGTLAWNEVGATNVRQRYQHGAVLASAHRRIRELLDHSSPS